ncbi:MAG: tRNA threonylcarbamoyladenosine dehydratase [Ruminococcaceae bacterium]|nr:tRNA threonylcarbamoyladenosine dehydratase [Oscillospiraceae bacterium]
MEFTQRTQMVVGEDRFNKVTDKKICIVGVGGVGGAALEGIVRFGFKNIAIFDFDTVDITNLNRQIISTRDAVGQKKTAVAAARAKSINPDINIETFDVFIEKDNLNLIKDLKPDYVIDAIDSVRAKLDLIEFCHRENIPVISSMGTGNRLNCTGFVIDKVEKTAGNGCGLSKVMRQELKKRGITGHTALYYTRPPESKAVNSANGRNAPGSCPFAPNIAGLAVAQYVVSQLL